MRCMCVHTQVLTFPAKGPQGIQVLYNMTRALCACMGHYAQVVTFPAKGPKVFEYDPEWLAIMRTTHQYINLNRPHK